MTTTQTQLEHILRHGETMLRTVESEQWERLAELQAQRQQLLESYFTSEILSHEARRQTLRQLFRFNQRLIDAVVAKRTELAENLRGVSVGRQALRAYQQCGD